MLQIVGGMTMEMAMRPWYVMSIMMLALDEGRRKKKKKKKTVKSLCGDRPSRAAKQGHGCVRHKSSVFFFLAD